MAARPTSTSRRPVRMASVTGVASVMGMSSHCCASLAGRPRSPMTRAWSPSRRAMRGDRRAHGIRHVVGHDLHDGVHRVGRRQLPGDPGEAREALPDPLSDAGRVVAHPGWGHHAAHRCRSARYLSLVHLRGARRSTAHDGVDDRLV